MAPEAGVNVPATGSKTPPVPLPVRVQTPPGCSPVMSVFKTIGVVLLSQIVVAPSTPALGAAMTIILT